MISSPFKLPSKMSPNVLHVSEVAEVDLGALQRTTLPKE
jgi:hypothetical protein